MLPSYIHVCARVCVCIICIHTYTYLYISSFHFCKDIKMSFILFCTIIEAACSLTDVGYAWYIKMAYINIYLSLIHFCIWIFLKHIKVHMFLSGNSFYDKNSKAIYFLIMYVNIYLYITWILCIKLSRVVLLRITLTLPII